MVLLAMYCADVKRETQMPAERMRRCHLTSRLMSAHADSPAAVDRTDPADRERVCR